ncbi:MAG: efflux RND transporter periplasmic adaptor subunit [Alphaproteobacteria bacterium]|nr:efflux RND transporter periplasmic adaptor subunit [Alphaproteobacteria bacterium]
MASAKPKLAVIAAVIAVVILGGGAAFIALHKPDAGAKSASAAGAHRAGPPGRGGRGGGAVGVVAVPAELREFSSQVEALGTLAPREQVVLSVNAADRVTSVNFEDGQRVKKGQVLLTIKSDEEQAQLEQAKATAADALETYNRNLRLSANQAISQADLDKSRAATDSAAANVRSLQARLSDHILLAPFDGVLGFRKVSLGAYVSLGQPVATLVDDSEMRLEFGVPSIYLSRIAPGVKIEARTADVPDRIFHGTLTSIDNAIDPVTRAVKVRATLPNKDGVLKSGMFMTVDLMPQPHQGLAIPEISIVAEGSDNFVYVVDETRQPAVAVKTAVTVGIREKGTLEITDGLHPGDLVVTDGVLKVRADGPVKVLSRQRTAEPVQAGDARVAVGEGPSGAVDLRQ